MMDILIVAHFTQAPNEVGNGRFHYLASLLSDDTENKVEVVTTSFSHQNKEQRKITKQQLDGLPYKFEMVYEPGYKKNVSIKRFYSHYIMGKNLKKYLSVRNKPDVIYCTVPSLEAAYATAKYAKENNVRFIIDVQDLWPEAFEMVFHVPILSNIIFSPMKKKANFIYGQADEIVAVSQTYANRALKVNRKCKSAHSIYLGTELSKFDEFAIENKIDKTKNEFWLAYIGTLGNSYNITVVIDALALLRDKGIDNIKFVVMGDGPLRDMFESYSKKMKINAEFTGALSYPEMVGKLCVCDLAVNPIKSGSAGSIINKVCDYAVAGLPVINTQECLEYRHLVEEFSIGLNCENNNARDMANKIFALYQNERLIKNMGMNNRRLSEIKFDRKKTYKGILTLIEDEK